MTKDHEAAYKDGLNRELLMVGPLRRAIIDALADLEDGKPDTARKRLSNAYEWSVEEMDAIATAIREAGLTQDEKKWVKAVAPGMAAQRQKFAKLGLQASPLIVGNTAGGAQAGPRTLTTPLAAALEDELSRLGFPSRSKVPQPMNRATEKKASQGRRSALNGERFR